MSGATDVPGPEVSLKTANLWASFPRQAKAALNSEGGRWAELGQNLDEMAADLPPRFHYVIGCQDCPDVERRYDTWCETQAWADGNRDGMGHASFHMSSAPGRADRRPEDELWGPPEPPPARKLAPEDNAALNAIAAALTARFEFLPLSVRYGAAEEALEIARAGYVPVGEAGEVVDADH